MEVLNILTTLSISKNMINVSVGFKTIWVSGSPPENMANAL